MSDFTLDFAEGDAADTVSPQITSKSLCCLLYTSDAADDMQCVDLGGRRIIKKIFFQAEDGIRDSP